MGIKVDSTDKISEMLTRLAEDLGLPTRLSKIKINEETLAQLAKVVFADGTHMNNPVPCSEESFLEIYKKAL
ncbi:iron-containing alcohol dehydrogenase [Thermodesulfobacteriota bacterium]